MDPRGLRALLTGAGCSSCGSAIAPDGVAVLADRGDLAFVELRCDACGSRTLGVVVAGEPGPVLDIAGHPELDPATEARLAGRPPIDVGDVVAMRRFLDRWDGDLRTLLDQDPLDDGPGGGGR